MVLKDKPPANKPIIFFKLIFWSIRIRRKSVDSSLYSLFAFGMFSPSDKMIESSIEVIMDRLWINTPVGGIARYEDDPYYRVSENTPGNPWIITTLWMTFYYIEIGNKEKSLELLD